MFMNTNKIDDEEYVYPYIFTEDEILELHDPIPFLITQNYENKIRKETGSTTVE